MYACSVAQQPERGVVTNGEGNRVIWYEVADVCSNGQAIKKTEQVGDTRVAPELIFLFLEWINESLIRRMFWRFLRRAMIFAL